jgi:hypothetical protein
MQLSPYNFDILLFDIIYEAEIAALLSLNIPCIATTAAMKKRQK